MENKQILTKLAAVMTDVAYIQKDAKNTHQGYRYASERVIKERLHESFVKNRIVMQLNYGTPFLVGNTIYVPVEYAFWDVDSGESLTGNCIGSGQNRDEKGCYAAITGAIKYILTGTFLIPTGDDPEDDKNEAPKAAAPDTMSSGTVSDKQWDMITKLRAQKALPDDFDADLTAWSGGNSQTAGEASGWIDKLKELPNKAKEVDKVATQAWIVKHELDVYPLVAKIKARQKYLDSESLNDVPTEKLVSYAKHIKEKMNEKKGATA